MAPSDGIQAGRVGDQQGARDGAGASESPTPGRRSRRWELGALPLVAFGGLTGMLAWGLGRDPSALPSALIGRQVPDFSLPPVRGRVLGQSSEDLVGEVSLVNVFASWCFACRAELPLLMRLSAAGTVPLHGLNYRDEPEDATDWLDSRGDPYERTGADGDGRVGIDLGVYGVPETFVLGADGRIAHRHASAVTSTILDGTILPLVTRLRRQVEDRSS